MPSLRACGGSCPEAQVSQTRPLGGGGAAVFIFCCSWQRPEGLRHRPTGVAPGPTQAAERLSSRGDAGPLCAPRVRLRGRLWPHCQALRRRREVTAGGRRQHTEMALPRQLDGGHGPGPSVQRCRGQRGRTSSRQQNVAEPWAAPPEPTDRSASPGHFRRLRSRSFEPPTSPRPHPSRPLGRPRCRRCRGSPEHRRRQEARGRRAARARRGPRRGRLCRRQARPVVLRTDQEGEWTPRESGGACRPALPSDRLTPQLRARPRPGPLRAEARGGGGGGRCRERRGGPATWAQTGAGTVVPCDGGPGLSQRGQRRLPHRGAPQWQGAQLGQQRRNGVWPRGLGGERKHGARGPSDRRAPLWPGGLGLPGVSAGD